jgi:cytochrome c nitrite reductase small subunit
MGSRTGLAILLGSVIGIAAGTALYTFVYAKGSSYLTNDPKACANCHVMQEYYDAWSRGPHRSVAVCNDCHTPHSPIPKYATKAANGWHHSSAFTSGNFPDNLHIRSHNLEITEHACRRCHEPVVTAIDAPAGHANPAISCVRCHASVGHLR